MAKWEVQVWDDDNGATLLREGSTCAGLHSAEEASEIARKLNAFDDLTAKVEELQEYCAKAGIGPYVGNYFMGKLTMLGQLNAAQHQARVAIEAQKTILARAEKAEALIVTLRSKLPPEGATLIEIIRMYRDLRNMSYVAARDLALKNFGVSTLSEFSKLPESAKRLSHESLNMEAAHV
jgi:hypothetical protein